MWWLIVLTTAGLSFTITLSQDQCEARRSLIQNTTTEFIYSGCIASGTHGPNDFAVRIDGNNVQINLSMLRDFVTDQRICTTEVCPQKK